MTNQAVRLPKVGITLGDPCGIGPEVLVKAWHSGQLHSICEPVLIGSCAVMREAARLCGFDMKVRAVERAMPDGERGTLDVIEPVDFDINQIRYGEDLAYAGWAVGAWLEHADLLARQGALSASVMGPISSASLELAGALGSVATNKDGGAYLLLRSGPLMIAHLTDHVPLSAVSALITREGVLRLIRSVNAWMVDCGVTSRRIAIAGFNPHASGIEEQEQIAPAVAIACSEGIDVSGPFSPDTVFRHCIDGHYDIVLALYHDQGHIAMKTWGFSGNSVAMIGPPYVHTTVAHGVAYDLAGQGRADHTMMLNSILNAASLAAGQGFQA